MLRDFLICTAFAVAILFASGCSSVTPPPPAQQAGLVWCQNLECAALLWHAEAERRFGPNVFVFAAHGSQVGNEWECWPDGRNPQSVESVANVLSDLYPKRTIVLLVCNGGGRTIDVPRRNVYFAMKPVACIPHSCLPGCVDSIWDFRN